MSLLYEDKIQSAVDLRNWLDAKLPGCELVRQLSVKDLLSYQEHFNSRVEIVHGVGNMPMGDFWAKQKAKEEVPQLRGQFKVTKEGWMQLYELLKFLPLWEAKANGRLPKAEQPVFRKLEMKWRSLVLNDDWYSYQQFLQRQEWAMKKQKERKRKEKAANKTKVNLMKSAPLFYDQLIGDELKKTEEGNA